MTPTNAAEETARLMAEIAELRTHVDQLRARPMRRVSLPVKMALALLPGLIGILLFAGLAGATTILHPVQNGVVNSCYNTKTGAIRLIDPTLPKQVCKKTEAGLTWSNRKNVAGTIDGSTGNIVSGTGYIAHRNAPGNYTITFPAGTFSTYAAIALTPVGRYPQFVFDGGYGNDGSYVFNVATTDSVDTSFSFVATDTN